MMTHPAVSRAGAALLAVLAFTACTDRSATGPSERPPAPLPPLTPGTNIAALTCTASVRAGTVVCAPPTPSTGAADGIIVGNQGVYVQLTSTNISYNPGTGQFTFDATLQNLLEQPLGTTDGGTPDPGGINIFFHELPTTVAGTGSVAVVPDGFGTFLAAAQPYYNYPYLLQQTDVSPAETWTFIMPPTVTSFTFGVYVSAPVEFPNGYITLNGELPGASYGALHPGTPVGLTAVVKNAVGVTVPGTVTFATTDPDCASVNGAGTVTGVRAASCSITATSGAFAGEMLFDVTGTQRTWNGSVSADWSVGANWDGGYVPAAVDSAVVPTGVPAFPALSAAVAIGGVNVADGATLSLGAFDLTASASVATGPTAGSGILGTSGVLRLAGASQTVRGRVPSVAVTGTYALDNDLYVVAPGRVLAGQVRNAGYRLRAVSQ
jgi:uncharacterized protein YaiE (UPF0345 family)